MLVKFARISFHHEIVEYSLLMDLIIVHMVLVQKKERGFMSQCFGYDPCLLHQGVRPHVDMTLSWMISSIALLSKWPKFYLWFD